MARILPDVSGGFGPIVPQRQRFMTKVQSDEDKALKIIKAIGGGVQIASDLYGMGSEIYDKYIKETAAEAKARLQREMGDPEARQNVARSMLGGGMVGDQYDPMLGSRVPEFPLQPTPTQSGFAQARGEFAQDFADVGALGEADKAAPKLSQLPPTESQMAEAQQQGAAPAPATTGLNESEVIGDLGKLGRLLPQYAAQRGMNVDEVRNMLRAGDFRRRDLAPGSTETFGRYLDRMQRSGQFGAPASPASAPAALEPGRVKEDLVIDNFKKVLGRVAQMQDPGLEARLVEKSVELAEANGMPRAAAEFRAALAPRAQATFDYLQASPQQQFLQKPKTAREFLMGREGGREFSIRELNMAYNSLWRQGRQQEAEDLVRLAGVAKDIGQFVQSGTDSPVLIRARAEEAVAKMAKGGGGRISAAEAISLAKMKDKRRGGGGGGGRTGAIRPKGSPKDPTAEERQSKEFLIVTAERGIQTARDLYYDRGTKRATRQTTKDILAEARRILRDVPQKRFRTSPDYELVRSQYGQDFYKTSATEVAESDEAEETKASQAKAKNELSSLTGIAIEDFGDMSPVKNKIKAMEEEFSTLPNDPSPQPSDYTIPEGYSDYEEYVSAENPDKVRAQTTAIKERKKAQVARRRVLERNIPKAKNALRLLE